MTTKMHIEWTEADVLLDTLDVDLLGSMQAHMEERGSSSSAYVVPMKSIFIEGGLTEERCVVVGIPHTSRNEVNIGFKRIFSDVRITPDRKQRACLMLADGAVALTEAAVVGVAPLQFHRLVVVWMFEDEIAVSKYPYPDAANEALRRASQAVDSHAYPEKRGGGLRDPRKHTVVEVFDVFDVDGRLPI